MRAGGKTLTLLSAPRTFLILRSLAEGAKSQLELRLDAGSPAQSTLRGQLRALAAVGAVTRRRRESFPGALEYELTKTGRELLTVAADLERWLAMSPQGGLELGNDPARAAVKGLVDGWCARMLAPLAREPLSLTELDRRLPAVSYPTLERRLEAMRLAEQLEIRPRAGAGTPYAPTVWLRRGIAPLASAASWEHRHALDGAAPVSRGELESAFALMGPLLDLPADLSGSCQMAVRISEGGRRRRFSGLVEIRGGAITFGSVRPRRKPDAWASGSVDSWFAAVIDADTRGLRSSGDRALAETVLERSHRALSGEASGAVGEADAQPARGR